MLFRDATAGSESLSGWLDDVQLGGSEPGPLAIAQIDSILPVSAQPPEEIVTFSGSGEDPDGGAIQAYAWASSLDGPLSNQADFTRPSTELRVGSHTISLRVKDDEGTWSLPATHTLVISNALPSADVVSDDPVNIVPGQSVTAMVDVYDNDESSKGIADYRPTLDGEPFPMQRMMVTEQRADLRFTTPGDLAGGLHSACVAVQDDEGTW